MRIIATLTVICAISLTVASLARPSNPLDDAVRALSADSIKRLQFTGSGTTFTVGQNVSPTDPWPRVTVERSKVGCGSSLGSTHPQRKYLPLATLAPQRQLVVA